MGIYAEDGSINLTTVDGTDITGLYAEDGSINVVEDDEDFTGVYHPCGAFRVSTTEVNDIYDSTGALSISVWGRGTIESP